jgi:hypothetical protein
LSLPLYSNLILSNEVEVLADEIAGAGANAEIRQLACRIAEAQIDLRRVRHTRHQLLSDNYNDFRANINKKKATIDKPPRSAKNQTITGPGPLRATCDIATEICHSRVRRSAPQQ